MRYEILSYALPVCADTVQKGGISPSHGKHVRELDLRRLESANLTVCGWIWIWVTKNIPKEYLARFNSYNMYTICKRVPVHWTSIRRA